MRTNNSVGYDTVIVGAGATGAWAAKELTERGLRVLVLEAGGSNAAAEMEPRPTKDVLEMKRRYDRMRERQQTQSKCYACTPQASHLFVDDVDNPYSTSDGKPFFWIRGRQLGGRLWTWAGYTYRMSDFEFSAASRDGHGVDWPICYQDLAPHYDRIETFLGVSGTCDLIPNLPDGQYRYPGELTAGESRLKHAVESRWPERKVIVGRGISRQAPPKNAESHSGGCHDADSIISRAMNTGRLEIRKNAIASQILVDSSGKAAGVAYVDCETSATMEVHARAVVLCASTIESTRLLLNSTSRRYPNGLANSSGLVGCHLMDHVQVVIAGNAAAAPHDQANPNGIYFPQFRNTRSRDSRFVRGYGIQGGVSGASPGDPSSVHGLKTTKRLVQPFFMTSFGEMLPRMDNRVSVNSTKKDAWGIPVAHIECTHGDNEIEMEQDAKATLKEMAVAANFEITYEASTLNKPGLCVHEVGTARMGLDPRTSVLNKFNQSWDVSNLFVMDGASFASQGYQNPTLTMMALSGRASDYLAREFHKGAL